MSKIKAETAISETKQNT